MKKLVVLSSIIALLMLAACGNKNNDSETTTPTGTIAPTGAAETPSATPEPTQEAPASEADVATTLETIHQQVKDMFGENYIPSMEYDEAILSEQFGIESGWYDGIIAEGPMMSVHVEKLIVAHATEGNLENLQAALTAYQETIQADLMQYPMNIAKIQGSVVDVQGNYVFFIMLASSENEDEAAAIEECRELNQQVADMIKDTLKGQ